MTGSSQFALSIRARVARAAFDSRPVLVTGPTGSGKTQIAQAIHEASGCADRVLVVIDCRARDLVATAWRRDEAAEYRHDPLQAIREARGATVLLQYVSDLDLPQQKLVAAALHCNRSAATPARLVATDARPRRLIHRLGSLCAAMLAEIGDDEIEVASLSERVADLPFLAESLAARAARLQGVPAPIITAGAVQALGARRWPGNIRQLQHFIDQLVANTCDGIVTRDDVRRLCERHEEERGVDIPVGTSFPDAERRMIVATIEACGGSIAKAARALGLARRTIQYRLREYSGMPGRRRE